MSYIEKRQVGPYLFALFLPGKENSQWPWWINRTDAKDLHSSFGKPVALGRASTREEAMQALEAAFEEQARKVREAAR